MEHFTTIWNNFCGILKVNQHVFSYSIPIVLSILLFESIYFGWKDSSIRRLLTSSSSSSKMDIFLCVMHISRINELLSFILTLGLVSMVPNLALKYFNFNLMYWIPSPYLQVLLYVIVYDFCWYWKHRFAHKYAWLWHLHEVHHSSTDMNIITANRVHPVDEALNEILFAIPLALLGAPPEGYATAKLLKMAHTQILHSNLPWTWGWIGKYIIISPVAHQIHHSGDRAQENSNFGSVSPIWDHLFKTRCEDVVINKKVPEQKNRELHSFMQELLNAYFKSVKKILQFFVKLYN